MFPACSPCQAWPDELSKRRLQSYGGSASRDRVSVKLFSANHPEIASGPLAKSKAWQVRPGGSSIGWSAFEVGDSPLGNRTLPKAAIPVSAKSRQAA
jgi:hypothetical protein